MPLARLALFQHEPYCSRACGMGVIAALGPHHSIEQITLYDLTLEKLASFDIVIFPGGQGEASDFQYLLKGAKPVLKDYVRQGGRYLGICMGAYWADSSYFDLIGEIRCVRYVERPKAEIRRSFATVARIDWHGQTEKAYFFDGCAFIGSDSDIVIDATYANGDAMAIRKGAIGLIGCHLESEIDWYASAALKPLWHHLAHHALLKEFVDTMLSVSQKPAPDHSNGATQKEIERLTAALSEIEKETMPFSQGTYKKINRIAREALNLRPRKE